MSRTRDEGMQARIIEAAISVFGEKGFQETTLKDIAAGAGISTGSVYTYFEDKQDLFAAAATWGWDRFNDELAELATEDQSLEERLNALLGRGFALLTQSLPLMRGMLFDASRRNLVQPGLERTVAAIDRLLDPYFGKGRPKDEDGQHRKSLSLIRIFVTGILFSATFARPEDSPATLADFRMAMLAFFAMLEGQGRDAAVGKALAAPGGGSL